MDYTFPLPKSYLHLRYDPLFHAWKKGLSTVFIGLPQSARSGYLKFILEFHPEFLAEFINPKTNHFILIEGETLTPDQLIKQIAAQLHNLSILSQKDKKYLENRIQLGDPHLLLIALKEIIHHLTVGHHIIIILYEAEKILPHNPQSIRYLSQLWNIDRNQPDNKVILCFIVSPVFLELQNQPEFSLIKPALLEKTLYFPLFTHKELDYLRARLETLTEIQITPKTHQIASRLSAGHTVLYRLLTQVPEELENVSSHPSLESLLNTIWNGFPNLVKQNYSSQFLSSYPYTRLLNCYIPLLPPQKNRQETLSGQKLPLFTSHQKLLFDYFLNHQGQIITREDISFILWGKKAAEKYSDWAIDRLISRLKNKLKGSAYQIITLRNRGYQLVQN